MRATTESTIRVDFIRSHVDIGELTKLAVKFGMDVEVLFVGPDEDKMGPYTRLVAHRRGAEWLETEIVDMILLHSYASSKSVNTILEAVRRELAARHAPMDKPIQDVMSIGGGPEHEGHEHSSEE